jgi:Xaa-Pro dipeptidase
MTVKGAAPALAFTKEELSARIAATRAVMQDRGVTTLCLVSPENIYYLLGLNHQGYFAFTLLVLPLTGQPLLVTRAMEAPTVAAQAPSCIHMTFNDDEDPSAAAERAVRLVTESGDRVGIERTSMFLPIAIWETMRSRLKNLAWADGSGIVETVRAVKSPTEIEQMRRAALISDRAIQAGIAAARPGEDERTIAATIYHELLLAGSEHPGFPPLIRSADILLQEHVTGPRDRVIAAGNSLFMELSASIGRYHAPLSRMIYANRTPPGTNRAAEIAIAGLEAVRAALRPGVVAGDVYQAWQQVIDKGLGHSRYRRHHCGYLVGIGFPPSWVGGSAVVGLRRGGEFVIREGMTFHVLSWILHQEPADYIVSDTVLVTTSGGELLTATPREPIVVR